MDDAYSLDLLYADEYVPEELYRFVRDGLSSQLDARLHQLSNPIKYLISVTWHGQEKLSLLMVAALNGHDDIVRILFTHCDPIRQVELKGRVILYNTTRTRCVTALYCACYRGHFNVAKTLIEFGQANVRHSTRDYSNCPLLIHAISQNRQDIIEFLLKNKYADVNQIESCYAYKLTPLIWVAMQGRASLVKCLLENGADLNYSLRGSTAIMYAIQHDHLDVFRLLYDAGANIDNPNQTGDTLLVIAAKYKSHSIVRFLLEQSRINHNVDDLEFSACCLFDIECSHEHINVIFDLLRTALQRRQLLQIPKVCIQSMDIYDNQQECQTMDELDRIKTDRDRIFIETLLIQERLSTSEKYKSIMASLEKYGYRLMDKKEFDKCCDLYIHMFYLNQRMNMYENLTRLICLFRRMFAENQIISIHRFLQVCYLTHELKTDEYIEITIFSILRLVIIAAKILEQKGIIREERLLIYSWIRDLCRRQLTTSRGQTLLHVFIWLSESCINLNFPNEVGLRLLLSCGGRWLDLDARESCSGDTPLHIICKNKYANQEIIKILLKFGCHVDCVNKDGKTPLDYVDVKEIKDLFTSSTTPNHLKCLCARMITNQCWNVDVISTLATSLKKFIHLHDNRHISLGLNK